MELESWHPSATIEHLRQRALLLSHVRSFLNERGYLEVETPCLARYGVTDAFLANIPARFREETYFLQTSPEYHMKRLLAAGSGPIFQLAKVFRDDELGRWHNPEFTLLEWYQLNIDHHALMDEVEALLQSITGCGSMQRMTYQHLFREHCDIDPLQNEIKPLQATLSQFNLQHILPENETDVDQYLFLLMTHVIEPILAKATNPIAVYDFPPSQAALAKMNQGVAERFEVYYRGIELANGFHELTDVTAQKERFEKDLAKRAVLGLSLPNPDAFLLQALHQGLPACSGVALGIDRLIALVLNTPTIADIMSFDFSRA